MNSVIKLTISLFFSFHLLGQSKQIACSDIVFSKNRLTSYKAFDKDLHLLSEDSLSAVICLFVKAVYNDSVRVAKPLGKRGGVLYYHCEFRNIDGKLFIEKNGAVFFSGGYSTRQHLYFQTKGARLPRKVYRMFGY
jgi:hypothetical protein